MTEHLKLEKAPITKTEVTKFFSPTCGCSTARASIVFSLRLHGRVTISILDSDDHVVRTLLDSVNEPVGRLRVTWNGRDGSGLVAPDGEYRVRVHLPAERRTIQLPNVIHLDTSPPKITLLSIVPRAISPDEDGRADAAHIEFKLSKGSRALLFVDGRFVTRARLSSRKIDWHGKDSHGRLRLGLHRLTVRALDQAGNLSAPTSPVEVDVRFLQLRPTRINVAAGASFSVAISTDRRNVRWRFAGATRITRRKRLFLRAPAVPGQYWLLVRSDPYEAGALITVT
ncbi:MAG: FlgD immunoglobulin-like domain containing protein [Gaiellaceae bacterium]